MFLLTVKGNKSPRAYAVFSCIIKNNTTSPTLQRFYYCFVFLSNTLSYSHSFLFFPLQFLNTQSGLLQQSSAYVSTNLPHCSNASHAKWWVFHSGAYMSFMTHVVIQNQHRACFYRHKCVGKHIKTHNSS